jgi:hypothetical protein
MNYEDNYKGYDWMLYALAAVLIITLIMQM